MHSWSVLVADFCKLGKTLFQWTSTRRNCHKDHNYITRVWVLDSILWNDMLHETLCNRWLWRTIIKLYPIFCQRGPEWIELCNELIFFTIQLCRITNGDCVSTERSLCFIFDIMVILFAIEKLELLKEKNWGKFGLKIDPKMKFFEIFSKFYH